MLVREKTDVHVQKQTEHICCTKCGYNARFLKCRQVVHRVTTIIGGLCIYASSLNHILYCSNWSRSVTQAQQLKIKTKTGDWERLSLRLSCCLTVCIPDIQRNTKLWCCLLIHLFAKFIWTLKCSWKMTFGMVQLCSFSSLSLTHTHTHTQLCFRKVIFLIPLDHEGEDTRFFRNTCPKTHRHIQKSGIFSTEI